MKNVKLVSTSIWAVNPIRGSYYDLDHIPRRCLFCFRYWALFDLGSKNKKGDKDDQK